MEFQKLQKIIAEVLSIDDTDIVQEMSFIDDLGADSLELFQILMGVEKEFDISIDEETLKDVITVGDLLEIICQEKHRIKTKNVRSVPDETGKIIRVSEKNRI